MEKKSKAKAMMLKELSNEMSNDTNAPLKDMLGKKGMKKVSVMSDSPEGLKKGLSMAEKLMKLKSKQSGDEESEEEEEYSSEESSDSEEESMEESHEDMSKEDMVKMYEMLKAKLGK
jgi:TATA-binding protein-associated factor Taf7